MARLTYRTPDGNWGVRGIDVKQMPAAVYGALCKLKDYEDTGLEPSQLYQMDEAYRDMCKELAELKKAEGMKHGKEVRAL